MATTESAPLGLRSLVTPEGVPVHLELGDRGERAGAFLIDLMIMVLCLIGTYLVIGLGGLFVLGGNLAMALIIMISFFVRSFYFMAFELRWQGQTPGKRLLGLRVVDRRGGALAPSAIAARNMMREVEVFIPLSILLFPYQDAIGGLFTLVCILWLGIFTLMPLFNRDRMRVGDMIAGTWVVSGRKTELQRDLVSASTQPRGFRQKEPEQIAAMYTFTPAQLDVYGITELQVLETVLRAPDNVTTKTTIDEVWRRIRDKTGWQGEGPIDARRFLNDYYTALRAHLEQHMLFGDRRTDKHAMEERRTPKSATSDQSKT